MPLCTPILWLNSQQMLSFSSQFRCAVFSAQRKLLCSHTISSTSSKGWHHLSSSGYSRSCKLPSKFSTRHASSNSSSSTASSSSSSSSSSSLFSSSSFLVLSSVSYLPISLSLAYCSPNIYPINPAYLPPIRPQQVHYIPPSTHQETTFQYLKRQIHNLWRYLKRFFYASKRITECTLVIGSALLLTPPALYFGKEDYLWQYIVDSIQYLGPTFIKLAQWASSRPDLFPWVFPLPTDPCTYIPLVKISLLISKNFKIVWWYERLYPGPPHSFYQTYPWSIASNTLDKAFGENWRESLTLDETPIGSGCIAQVILTILTLFKLLLLLLLGIQGCINTSKWKETRCCSEINSSTCEEIDCCWYGYYEIFCKISRINSINWIFIDGWYRWGVCKGNASLYKLHYNDSISRIWQDKMISVLKQNI